MLAFHALIPSSQFPFPNSWREGKWNFPMGRKWNLRLVFPGIAGNGKFPYLACASSKLCEFIWKYANFDYHRVQVITLQKWKVSKLSACSQYFTLKQRLPLIYINVQICRYVAAQKKNKQTLSVFLKKAQLSDISCKVTSAVIMTDSKGTKMLNRIHVYLSFWNGHVLWVKVSVQLKVLLQASPG